MGPKRAQEGGAAPHKEGRLGPPSPSWTRAQAPFPLGGAAPPSWALLGPM